MLSYMVPVEEKPPPAPAPALKPRLALEFLGSPVGEAAARRTRTAISKESSTSSFASDLTLSSSTPTGSHEKPKHKLLGNGTKHTTLKRSVNIRELLFSSHNISRSVGSSASAPSNCHIYILKITN